MIKENLKQVLSIIEEAKKDSPYHQDVTLVAVSKTHPAEDIQEAYDAGIRDFGENKVQELMTKIDVLPQDIRWHLIGHLQRNKVRQLIGQTVLIHSVDSYRLAETISAEAVKAQIVMPVLIEVNAAKEDSKYGVMPENTEELVRAVSGLPGIHVEGLMTIAPYTDDPETNRPYFVLLRQLAVDIDNKCIDNVSMGKLSMGMTGDFEVAIEEGATHIRVGTGIFGERIYT